jgi:hypothetical protein
VYTHTELVERALKWLRNTAKCKVAVSEYRCTDLNQIPDAIGWKNARHSIMIECKASRSDFLADKKKVCRLAGTDLGQDKYYLINKGICEPEEIPQDWGLMYPTEKRILIIKKPKRKYYDPKVAAMELPILLSMVRRAEIQGYDANKKIPYTRRGKPRKTRRKSV